MKTASLLATLAIGTMLVSLAACKKQEPASSPAPNQANQAAGTAADTVKNAVGAGQAAAKEVVDQAQVIIDQAKKLVDAAKYQDALTSLNGLAGMTLTDAQQKLVTTLKEKIQKGIADQAAKQAGAAVGGLLKQ